MALDEHNAEVVPSRVARGRRQRPSGTRDAIREAVRELLRLRRLDELTVNEVVARAGVSRPTFYAHFDTKYSVVADLIRDIGDGIIEVWDPLFDGSGPVEEQLVYDLGMTTIELWRRQGSLFAATIEGWHSDAEIHDAWNEVLERFTDAFLARLRRDSADGRCDELLAAAMVTLFERSLYLAVIAGPDSPFARSDDQLARMLAGVWAKSLA